MTRLHWRWIYWILFIMCSFNTAIGYFFLRETYAPVLLNLKRERLIKENGGNYRFDGQDDRPLGCQTSTKHEATNCHFHPTNSLSNVPLASIDFCNDVSSVCNLEAMKLIVLQVFHSYQFAGHFRRSSIQLHVGTSRSAISRTWSRIFTQCMVHYTKNRYCLQQAYREE